MRTALAAASRYVVAGAAISPHGKVGGEPQANLNLLPGTARRTSWFPYLCLTRKPPARQGGKSIGAIGAAFGKGWIVRPATPCRITRLTGPRRKIFPAHNIYYRI